VSIFEKPRTYIDSRLQGLTMKKILVITAIALFSVMAFSPVAFASSHSSSTGSTSTNYTICYTPAFIRTAYNYPTNLDGTGQTIVIVDAFGSPTIQNDLARFDSLFGIPAPPSFTILCPTGGCPAFSPNNSHGPVGWAFETSLDVEYAHAMAPGANIVLAVASTNSGNAINNIEAQAISLYPGSIMSQSFGTPEFLINGNSAQLAQPRAIMQLHKRKGSLSSPLQATGELRTVSPPAQVVYRSPTPPFRPQAP